MKRTESPTDAFIKLARELGCEENEAAFGDC